MAVLSLSVSWIACSLLAEPRNSATEFRSRSAARRAAAAGLFNSWARPAESLPGPAAVARSTGAAHRAPGSRGAPASRVALRGASHDDAAGSGSGGGLGLSADHSASARFATSRKLTSYLGLIPTED